MTAILSIKWQTKLCTYPNGIEQYIGNYDTYLEHQKIQQQKQEIITPKVADYKLRKERESEIRKKKPLLKRT